MRTAREWLAVIGFAVSLVLLSGCAGGPGQSLSMADRTLVRSAQVGDVKVTQPMSYQAKGVGMGAVFTTPWTRTSVGPCAFGHQTRPTSSALS